MTSLVSRIPQPETIIHWSIPHKNGFILWKKKMLEVKLTLDIFA